MEFLLFYCRAGFEGDLAKEVQDKAAGKGIYGYPKLTANAGFITFHCHQPEDAKTFASVIDFHQLIFARQMLVCVAHLSDMATHDRLSEILSVAETLPHGAELHCEYPDTTDGRELSRFCRKFSVPARQALRKAGVLRRQTKAPSSPVKNLVDLHLFFISGAEVFVGYSMPQNRSPYPLGILRLKFPSDAPSRSTLKLDEAIQLFVPKEEQDARLAAGMHAVDLGACPGGWTYQLVRRGLFVQAVDNGAMAESLMDSGQVRYFPEDGFRYQPKKKNVTWLVCDMIEQPQRVARLMADWLIKGWCKEAIFNLKLPMKRRYESVVEGLQIIDEVLGEQPYQIQAKHLYHDREEITVHLRLRRR